MKACPKLEFRGVCTEFGLIDPAVRRLATGASTIARKMRATRNSLGRPSEKWRSNSIAKPASSCPSRAARIGPAARSILPGARQQPTHGRRQPAVEPAGHRRRQRRGRGTLSRARLRRSGVLAHLCGASSEACRVGHQGNSIVGRGRLLVLRGGDGVGHRRRRRFGAEAQATAVARDQRRARTGW